MAKPLRDEREFCSELVVGLLHELRVPPFHKLSRRWPSAYSPAHLRMELTGKSWQCLDSDFDQYLKSYTEPHYGMAPSELRETLMNIILQRTSSVIDECMLHSGSIRTDLLGLRTLQGVLGQWNVAALTQQRVALERNVLLGKMYLQRIAREEAIQRGAPWMGGKEQRQRLIVAKKKLEAALRQGTTALRK